MISSDSRNRAVAAVCFRARFHTTFISSKASNSGACRRWPSISSRTRPAPVSANTSAAMADASITLSRIAHLADEIHRARSFRQIQFLDPFVHVPGREEGGFLCGALDNIEQFTLERPPVSFCALPKTVNDRLGHVLDGEADGHGSIIYPKRNWANSRGACQRLQAGGWGGTRR